MAEFTDLYGKTLTEIKGSEGSDEMIFTTSEGERFMLYHEQDCCEAVEIEDIAGDIADLVGTPITMAEEVINENPLENVMRDDNETWTFYKLATVKGYVTIRWVGSSNGYYSESVDFKRVREEKRNG